MMLEVKESRIHRMGCFAKAKISKGEIIGEYIGNRITSRQADKINTDNETYLFEIDNGKVLDATNIEFPLKYANHSCTPNAESYEEDGRVFLEASRTINPGEEITYDYNLISEDNVECRCKTKNCNGLMNRKNIKIGRK